MLAPVKVLGGVLVFRGIAAAHMSTAKAQSQVDPGITNLDAILAFVFGSVLNLDLIEMSASFGHVLYLSRAARSHPANSAPAA